MSKLANLVLLEFQGPYKIQISKNFIHFFDLSQKTPSKKKRPTFKIVIFIFVFSVRTRLENGIIIIL